MDHFDPNSMMDVDKILRSVKAKPLLVLWIPAHPSY